MVNPTPGNVEQMGLVALNPAYVKYLRFSGESVDCRPCDSIDEVAKPGGCPHAGGMRTADAVSVAGRFTIGGGGRIC